QLYGDAFVLDQKQTDEWLGKTPSLGQWLRVYVNGDVLNETVTADAGLRVADFGEHEEHELSGCGPFLSWLKPQILEARAMQTRQVHETRPWLHWDKRTKFFLAARTRSRLLVCSTPSTYFAFRFAAPEKFFMQDIVVFAEDDDAFLAIMQSRIHETWAYAT